MPSFPDLEEPLSDGVVTLRLAEERDIPEILIAYQDDRGLHGALGEERPPSGAALGRRAELADEELRAGTRLTFTILTAGTDVCRGEVRVSDVDWARSRARVTVWLAPGSRGHGLARRAHALACGWLRSACGLEAECAPVPL